MTIQDAIELFKKHQSATVRKNTIKSYADIEPSVVFRWKSLFMSIITVKLFSSENLRTPA
jgi:hypothetical protein